MSDKKTLGEMLTERGVSRRTFLKYASYTASIMALPPTAVWREWSSYASRRSDSSDRPEVSRFTSRRRGRR